MQRLSLMLPVFSLVIAQPDILLTKTIIESGRIHNGSMPILFIKKFISENNHDI